ncbi:MAG TPA: hypothetical protein VIJ09_10675 [Acidimicrobiales bacterium]|jgi:heme/copper-type cytochrome/quinol oxidase subunit 1
MNHRQRIVVVIGLGVVLGAFGEWVSSWRDGFGWAGYAPLSQATFSPPNGIDPWIRLVIWLALAAVWTGSSVWLLRSSAGSESP